MTYRVPDVYEKQQERDSAESAAITGRGLRGKTDYIIIFLSLAEIVE